MKTPSRLLLALTLAIAAVTGAPAKDLPEFDESARKDRTGPAPFTLQAGDEALVRKGTVVHQDGRFGVPAFIWAAPRGAGLGRALSSGGASRPEVAARDHLSEYGHLYGLDDDDVQAAPLTSIHDTGRGGIIVSFHQEVGGIEVFRDEIKVLMNRDHELIALSGFIRGAAAARGRPLRFDLAAPKALLRAMEDYLSPKTSGLDPRAFQAKGEKPGGYESFEANHRSLEGLGLTMPEPARVKRILFDLPEGLEPAFYLELSLGALDTEDADCYAWVISALDGRILMRHNLTASDSFSYRVWAESTGLRMPLDGPQGSVGSPHPTGTPDRYQAPFTSPALITLQNGPISTNDPWLPPGSTTASGNNADAYADIFAPDGYSGGDLRASTTSANTFDRTYNTTLSPSSSQAQQMASITQLFYDVNFLHDWFYDAGFDEISRNAQQTNYGRGGVESDSMKAEGQDSSGRNNANMSTPADGGRPRMQMFVFDGNGLRTTTIDAPAGITGTYYSGSATFGPQAFTITGNIVQALDGVGTTTDGCETITNNVTGKIAFIDRGTCTFTVKVQNAQTAGAIGVIIANVASSASPTVPPGMGGTPTITITIGSLSLSLADGDLIRGQFGSTVHGTLYREAAIDRDGTIDNQIVAHEWGHYISNRLIGNAAGLTNMQGGGMGEGWGDFHAMLTTVRAEDAAVPATPNFTGAYGLATYVASGGGNDGYYYGIRRYPYSIDFGKNPLTLRHIGDGAPMPAGPPISFGSAGTSNAEVHNAGEVWAAMLWECYAALLRDSGRLTFNQAQDRMVDYLVAGYKLTPDAPTFLEARDAILSAALSRDFNDYILFWKAFARRGAGAHAVAPDRNSIANQGAVESFQPGVDLYFAGAAIDDVVATGCDGDGILDNNETAKLRITLENVGSIALNSTTITVTTNNPNVTFPSGNVVAVSALDDVEIGGVQFRLGGSNLGTEDTASPYSVSWDTTATGDGLHTLTAVARDTAGNTNTSAAVSVAVNNGPDEIHWTITGQTSVTFDWRGADWEKTISYGTSAGSYTNTVTAVNPTPPLVPFSSPDPFWEAPLTGLQENTLYHYSIAGGQDHTFRTPPPRGASGFTVFVEGDIGDVDSYPRVGPVQSLIAAGQPAFTLLVGDLTYGNPKGQAAVDHHFNDVMVWSQDAAYMPAWGNHEWDSPLDDLRNYKGRFDFLNSQTSPGSPSVSCCGDDWYWFDYGNVRFIAYPEPWSGAWSDWNSKASALMDAAQADANITFIVTYGHRPAYSSGHHPGNSTLKVYLDALGAGHSKYVLNFNGHSHNYERTSPQSGVTHITAGTGGSSLEQDSGGIACLDIWLACPAPSFTAFRAMRLGPVKLTFTATAIQGEFICGPTGGGTNDLTGTQCPQGAVGDSFTIGTVSAKSTGKVGVLGEQFRRDGNNLHDEDTNAAAERSHTLEPLARGAAGNWRIQHAVGPAMRDPDTTPPTISIISPRPGTTLSGPTTVSAIATATAMLPGATKTVSMDVAMSGAVGLQQVDFNISYVDPDFRIPGTVTQPSSHRGNYDDRANQSASDDVESNASRWTISGNGSLGQSGPWRRIGTPYSHAWFGPGVNELSDQWLVSPTLNVSPTGSFSFSFSHRYIFEYAAGPPLTLYDGGVIEISTNGGSTWSDIGAFATPTYSGTLASGSGNPIAGRPAYVQISPGFPAFQTVTVSLGAAYQGQNVRIRFRVATDTNGDEYGWEIDDIVFSNVTNLPFNSLAAEDGICPDSDLDGAYDFVDCAPSDPTLWSIPSEALGLQLTDPLSTSLTWSPPALAGWTGVATYDVLRSTSASSFAAAACVESNGTDLVAVDSGTPAPIFFYLIRSENPCGGNLGARSDTTPRTGINCP